MKEILFGDEEWYYDPYDDDKFWSTQEVAEIVLSDMKEPLDSNGVLKAIDSGWFPGYPERSWDYWRLEKDAREKAWEEHYKEVEKKAKELAYQFVSDNKNCQFFEFEYSDNDGSQQCALEHGDLFNRLPHLKISHH